MSIVELLLHEKDNEYNMFKRLQPGPEIMKLFVMLNSTGHEISTAHKN